MSLTEFDGPCNIRHSEAEVVAIDGPASLRAAVVARLEADGWTIRSEAGSFSTEGTTRFHVRAERGRPDGIDVPALAAEVERLTPPFKADVASDDPREAIVGFILQLEAEVKRLRAELAEARDDPPQRGKLSYRGSNGKWFDSANEAAGVYTHSEEGRETP